MLREVIDRSMATPQIRRATGRDTRAILAVLMEVAPEIPLRLDTAEHCDAVSRIVTRLARDRASWVATDKRGKVIGFQLVEPDEMERFLHANQALHLKYGGVERRHREKGVFRALVQRVMAENVPLTAVVKNDNRSDMAARLCRMGFVRQSISDAEVALKWQP
jgi:hypothetical protein